MNTPTDDLGELTNRALAWRKRNDGGRMHAKSWPQHDPEKIGPQICVDWDHGGYHELGCLYAGKRSRDDAELICDLVNWALEILVPSERGFYGDRT